MLGEVVKHGMCGDREVVKASAVNFKKLHMELGGKNPVLVFADADLERAIPGIIGAAFSNAGQNCAAGTRVIAEASIHDELVERLAVATKQMRVGSPMNEDTEMGPLVSATTRRFTLASTTVTLSTSSAASASMALRVFDSSQTPPQAVQPST